MNTTNTCPAPVTRRFRRVRETNSSGTGNRVHGEVCLTNTILYGSVFTGCKVCRFAAGMKLIRYSGGGPFFVPEIGLRETVQRKRTVGSTCPEETENKKTGRLRPPETARNRLENTITRPARVCVLHARISVLCSIKLLCVLHVADGVEEQWGVHLWPTFV